MNASSRSTTVEPLSSKTNLRRAILEDQNRSLNYTFTPPSSRKPSLQSDEILHSKPILPNLTATDVPLTYFTFNLSQHRYTSPIIDLLKRARLLYRLTTDSSRQTLLTYFASHTRLTKQCRLGRSDMSPCASRCSAWGALAVR